jgi:hypothetical protein
LKEWGLYPVQQLSGAVCGESRTHGFEVEAHLGNKDVDYNNIYVSLALAALLLILSVRLAISLYQAS